MNKILFSERLTRERDRFELLLNQVGHAHRLTMRGPRRGQSVKDVWAEVLTHEQFISDRLSEIVHGITYSPSTTLEELAAFEEKFGVPDYESALVKSERADSHPIDRLKTVSVDELVIRELAAYEELTTLLGRLTHDQCVTFDAYHRVAEHTYRQYRRAALDIRRWLQSIADQSG